MKFNKRKGRTAPGMDGVQNFKWKKLKAAQNALLNAFKRIIYDNSMIPRWWPMGRAVLLAKTQNLSDKKNYQPTACLNTSYKIITGCIAKYMHEYTLVNKIWEQE